MGVLGWLVWAGWQAAGCSSVESPASGAGGAAGTGGAGGAGPCPKAEYCVPSCSVPPSDYIPAACDATGTVLPCPAGRVRLGSCADDACAHDGTSCCDDTTGAVNDAVCGPDGVFEPCAAGGRLSQQGCIPGGLGISSCAQLYNQSCLQVDQECHSDLTACTCRAGDGGPAFWECATLLI